MGSATPGPDRPAGDPRLTCTIGDGQHYVITESDGARVCQKCGAVIRAGRGMPARRRHYPGRGPAAGISGTRAAYDSCRGCGHARVKHLTGPLPGCAGLVYATDADGRQYTPPRTGACLCTWFRESEE